MAVELGGAYELHPDVALRPEPFGALAYHYGTRRLVFLNHQDVVSVVRDLSRRGSLAESLRSCGVDERRWPSFVAALSSLESSGVVRARVAAG
jgi:putative mycofactocin binding protein MftB